MNQQATMATVGTTKTESSSPSMTDDDSPDGVKKNHSISDLNYLYQESESADQHIYAEMRSNLLLVAGDHYQKRESLFHRRLRDTKDVANEQKLRLTKNHIRKICQTYVNNIMSSSPGVGFEPKNEKELHDQKVADLHHSIWRDAFEKYGIDDLMDDWCDNFVEIGETAVKIFFDPAKGELKGYGPKLDAEGQPELSYAPEHIGPDGQPGIDPMTGAPHQGQMTPDHDSPIHMGEFVFEEIYGFNLLRPAECRDLKRAEWLGVRKMSNTDDLKLRYKNDTDKLRFVQETNDDTYQIFDASNGGYQKPNKNQVCIREYFFRPCLKYPKGYFYITTKAGILEEGELPGGIFPIVVQVFDKVQTTARGRSIVKQMRPYQAEINRSASKMAEHQITLGDDKLMIPNGGKVTPGVGIPGIRTVAYTGGQPIVLAGRSGAQYLDYMNSQIVEMYQVMNVAEDSEESSQAQLDPYVMLFRSARQKRKFQRYTKRFEKFLINVVKTYLSLAKIHLDDESLVLAIGSSERVNIPEWKQMSDLCYEVKVEAQAEDIESKLGKQIVLNNALQYVGSQLKPEDIGKFMRAMPLADFDQSFDDMTMDYDNSVNDILALQRGEQPPITPYDNHIYMTKRLVSRMRKPDYRYLPQNVQQAFEQRKAQHEQIQAQQAAELQRAEQGFIPTSGYLVGMDFYVTDPADPTGVKTRRARLPQDAINWLIKQLESQGTGIGEMQEMNQGAQVDIARQMQAGGAGGPTPQPGGNPPPGMSQGPQSMGQGVMNAPRSGNPAGPGQQFHP